MLSFDTPGPRRRGGGASASLGFSAAKRSVAFSMPDGLIGGRGGKPFKRRICGRLGKTDNCQIAVTLSIANHAASLPIAYELYLPEDWAVDAARRKKARPGGAKYLAYPRVPDPEAPLLAGLFRPGSACYSSLIWTNTTTGERVGSINYEAHLGPESGRVRLY